LLDSSVEKSELAINTVRPAEIAMRAMRRMLRAGPIAGKRRQVLPLPAIERRFDSAGSGLASVPVVDCRLLTIYSSRYLIATC